jgi:hypothetical protein
MDFKIGDHIVVNPSFYQDKLLGHTLRGIVKETKWNMILIQFNNGQIEWVEDKYVYSSSES